MKYAIVMMLAFGLSACGTDGEPITPNLNAGVSVGSNGVNTSAGVSVRKGPLTVGWNIF